jgi:hypothetical protein
VRAAQGALDAAAGTEVQAYYDRLGSRYDAALLRLLRMRAPHLEAMAVKIELLVEQQVWELAEGEACLAAVVRDARALAAAGVGGSRTA